MALLTTEEFFSYSRGISEASVNEALLELLIDSVSEAIVDETGLLFSNTTIGAGQPITHIDIPGKGIDLLKIGVWTSIDSVKIGYYGVATPPTFDLVENQHFVFETYKAGMLQTTSSEKVAIRILGLSGIQKDWRYAERWSNKLDNNTFIRLTGIYGFSELPATLKELLYKLVFVQLQLQQNSIDNNSFATIRTERDHTSSISMNEMTTKEVESLTFNIIENPRVAALLDKYRQYGVSQATIA